MTADALLTLAHVVEPGDQRIGALVEDLGAVEVVARIRDGSIHSRHEDALRARLSLVDLDDVRKKADERGVRLVMRGDAEWPSQLDDLGAARPYVLWVLGSPNLRLAALKSVAMIGARASTPYGERIAREWSGQLSDLGWLVVSGGAYGIDAAVHRGALAAGGLTACVLATGIDVAYPRAHEELLARIADSGLLISESPLGVQARRQRFLTRNRVIAALTRATVVVEAALRSGTTSTANSAFTLNRPVLAVPGPTTSPMSAGCHHLIREHAATLAAGWSDILEFLGAGSLESASADSKRLAAHSRPTDVLNEIQARVLDAFPGSRPIDLQQLLIESGVGTHALLGALGTLEMLNFVVRSNDGWRIVRA
ncbi:MAG: DNA-processing protein DprA [Actinomycetota bacterium]|nr:DNA-processing protein DprA [Actinomycetota bacterium]MDP2288388.1 DNA-processing protein DprA [Actinomycetota bacterium]